MAAGRGRDRVGIRDVAAAAGVSPTTVSHALNGRGTVSDATRRRIVETAERLGYSPSRSARALRLARTDTLALVRSDVVGKMRAPAPFEHVMLLTDAAASAAVAHGRRLLISPPLKSRLDVDRLSVDGAIVADGAAGDSQLALFANEEIPVVTLERHPDHLTHRFHVNVDNTACMNRLLDHLAAAGGERIALLVPDWSGIAWMTDSLQAYSEWCARHRREPIVELSSPVDVPEAAFEQSLRLLGREQRPDAILSVSETIQGGVLRAARELGLAVPGDLLVAAYNDSAAAKLADPPITALDLNSDQHGRLAVELLIELIEQRTPAAPVIVPATLNVRASTCRAGAA